MVQKIAVSLLLTVITSYAEQTPNAQETVKAEISFPRIYDLTRPGMRDFRIPKTGCFNCHPEDGKAVAVQADQSSVMPGSNPEFLSKIALPMIEERDKLGKAIGNFKNLSEHEKTNLFGQADKLFEFKYDLEDAHRRFFEDRLFSLNAVNK